ncbi:MAG: hypothetical protein CL878_09995 [Dehalococcoidia bacterium]|nr:hypothetical protein [Dehalococcoidia bacterium]
MGRDDQLSRIIDLKKQINRALHGAMPEPLSRLDLTVAQMRILYLLGREGEVAVGQVAERLGVAQPSATRTLDRLVRQGLVERIGHPADRRVSLHRLAPAGQGILDQLQQGRRARLEAALRRLNPAVLDQVAEAFRLLRDALDEVAANVRAAESREGLGSSALESTRAPAPAASRGTPTEGQT